MALLVTSTSSIAVQASPLNDKHLFRFGVYEQDIDVKASAVRDPLPEVELDFDEFLGIDESSKSFFIQYQWRFKENWALRTFYTNMEADGRKRSSKPFNWDGQEYEAGLSLGSEFGVDTYLLAVDYTFVNNDKAELGIGFGLHAFDIETTIEIELNVENIDDGEEGRRRVVRNNSDLLAPLPNFRGFGRYAFTPKWSIEGAIGWLSANYEDYEGDYLFLTLLTEYRITDRFGVGITYQVSEIDVTHDKSRGEDSFDIEQYGPSIFVSYGF
jgi:hypothetical protein